MKHWILLGVTTAAIHAGYAPAATAPVSEGLRACMAENDDARRLACYDRELHRRSHSDPSAEAGTASSASTASGDKDVLSVTAASAAPVAAAAPPAAQDDFGVRGSDVARRREQEQKKENPQTAQLTAAVTAVSKQPRGELTITLENGQVWQQKKPESYFPLRLGDQVNISSGALGSYWLMAPSGRSTPVTRIR